jgi:hypothetical protein
MSSIDFVLDRFSAAYTLSQSATMFEGTSIAFTDASATAVFYVSEANMKNVFKFQSDSFDINDLSASDIRYFTYMSNWPEGLVINPVNAMLDKAESANAITSVGIPNKMLVKHDFIRYLALKLFNTPSGVDLFNNENELIAHLNDMGNASYQNDISGSLWKYATNASTAVDNTNFILDASSNDKCTTDHLTSNDNICRELFNQILYANKSRFSDISFNIEDGVCSLPILSGDSISYRFTVFPKAGQNDITGVPAFGGRSYRIKLLIVGDAAGENTTVDGTELSTANVTYTKNE